MAGFRDETSTHGWEIDELARRSGITSRNIREYQAQGLLPGPKLVGRKGYYSGKHLERLELIRRLREQGYGLKAIEAAIERTFKGLDSREAMALEGMLGLDGAELAAPRPLTAREQTRYVRDSELTDEVIGRAIQVGFLSMKEDGTLIVEQPEILDLYDRLRALGYTPMELVELWARQKQILEPLVRSFIETFLANSWPDRTRPPDVETISEQLGEARHLMGQVIRLTFTSLAVDTLREELKQAPQAQAS